MGMRSPTAWLHPIAKAWANETTSMIFIRNKVMHSKKARIPKRTTQMHSNKLFCIPFPKGRITKRPSSLN